jgi:MYXO-CTERM domain-containing protein
VKNEFTIDRMARGAASVVPFLSAPQPAQAIAEGEGGAEGAAAMSDDYAGVEDVGTAASELDVAAFDPSEPWADPGSEEGISLASCRYAPQGSPTLPGFLGGLGIAALLLRARRRRLGVKKAQ